MNLISAISLCTIIAIYAHFRKSLSRSGIFGAFLVGIPTFSHRDSIFSVILITFFFAGTLATKLFPSAKKSRDAHHKVPRDIFQVLSNATSGVIIVIAHGLMYKSRNPCFMIDRTHTILLLGYIGHYACCAGDTLASEIGISSYSKPYLITTLKQVPHGTNGAISLKGTIASCFGGLVIGLVSVPFILSEQSCTHQSAAIFFILTFAGGLSGLFGSIIDSLLGATAQASYFSKKQNIVVDRDVSDCIHISGINLLSNNAVNALSSFITALIIGVVGFILV